MKLFKIYGTLKNNEIIQIKDNAFHDQQKIQNLEKVNISSSFKL